MTPGLVAFFVTISILFAFYALLAPTNTTVETPEGDRLDKNLGGLFERIVRPAVRNFLPQSPLALTEYSHRNEGVRALLARTGNPWKVSPEEYVGVRVLAVLAATAAATFLAALGFIPTSVWLAAFLGAGFGYLVPKVALDTRWARRRRELNATLPEALDLLRICMNAGYTFPNALKQTTEMLPPGTTRDELGRASEELSAGRTLSEALNSLVYRCPTNGVEEFSRAIVQANETGSDITDTLALQSEDARSEYERVVEVRAQKLQTTLFIPMILFLLPALMIFLFGPALAGLNQAF